MATTYTDSGRFPLQGTGDNPNTWGDIANTAFSLIDDMIGGVHTVNVTTGTDVTLSTSDGSTDEARNMVLKLSGTPSANINVIVPAVEKMYLIDGSGLSGSNTVTVKPSGANGVEVSSGEGKVVYCDGTDVIEIEVTPDNVMITTNNLSDLTNVSAARDNLSLGDISTLTLSSVSFSILESTYPVGSIYMNTSDATNPGTLLGFGTWEALGEGRVLMGVGTGTDINGVSVAVSIGEEGGEYEHTLTNDEVPTSVYGQVYSANSPPSNGTPPQYAATGSGIRFDSFQDGEDKRLRQNSLGSGDAHNNIQPYIGVYMWKRTA